MEGVDHMAAVREAERVISHELEKELWSHAGKWAFVTHSELVALGDTPREALERAKEKRSSLEGLLLHHIPEDEGKHYFF
jgi:hypothetical protein